MGLPGFTAEAALRHSSRNYRSAPAARLTTRSAASALTPQSGWWDCSDDGLLCYECDDIDGCFCDWFYGDAWIVTTDCGSR